MMIDTLDDAGSSVRIKDRILPGQCLPLCLIWSWWVHLITGAHTHSRTPGTVCAQACIPSSTRMLTHAANKLVHILSTLVAAALRLR